MATVNVDKAYKNYLKSLKGMPSNKANSNRMTKAQFIAKNFPNYGKNRRTGRVESGLKAAGLSYGDIMRLKGKKK
jgi:hypothetical protein